MDIPRVVYSLFSISNISLFLSNTRAVELHIFHQHNRKAFVPFWMCQLSICTDPVKKFKAHKTKHSTPLFYHTHVTCPFLIGKTFIFPQSNFFSYVNSQVHLQLTPFDSRKLLVSSDFQFINFSPQAKKVKKCKLVGKFPKRG